MTKLIDQNKSSVKKITADTENTTVLKKIEKHTNKTEFRPQKTLSAECADSNNEIQNSKNYGVLKQRFILTEIIGTGGMGIVYKAKDLLKVEAQDSDPYIAIKVLSEEFKKHPDAFISLQRESRKSQQIAHPNIVNVYDFDRDGDTVFMTMEYMKGKPLDQLLRENNYQGLPREYAFKILKQICSGLNHAHSENIIHSDLKPGNIFVTSNNVVKVFDFGIARAVSKVTHIKNNNSHETLFDAGNLGALTPAYASLEMLQGEVPDRRDDIYALGCIAYELLTGKHPFNRVPADESQKQKLLAYKITHIRLSQWRAIERALAFSRSDRISSTLDFQNIIAGNNKRNYTIPFVMVVLIVAIMVGLIQISKITQTTITETEIRKKIAYELQLETQNNIIKDLLARRNFSRQGQKKLQFEFSRLEATLKKVHDQYSELEAQNKIKVFSLLRDTIINEYLLEIRRMADRGSNTIVNNLIKNSYFYAGKNKELTTKLDFSIKEFKSQAKIVAINNQYNSTMSPIHNKKPSQDSELNENQFISLNNSFKSILETKKNRLFKTTLVKVYQQLACTKPLDTDAFNINVKKLRAFNLNSYRKIETEILTQLSSCIIAVASTHPKTALKYKQAALQLFNNEPMIKEIDIKL